jgi:hypothetical protein
MDTRINIYIALVLILSSCCGLHTEVTYNYNGTTIKRVDECGITTFYYNSIEKNSGEIWVKYSGINDGFSGYLKFEEDGKVLLLSSDGYFQSKNMDTTKFEYRRIAKPGQIPELNESVYFVMLSTRYEKERNLNSKTKVKTEYNIDKNARW